MGLNGLFNLKGESDTRGIFCIKNLPSLGLFGFWHITIILISALISELSAF